MVNPIDIATFELLHIHAATEIVYDLGYAMREPYITGVLDGPSDSYRTGLAIQQGVNGRWRRHVRATAARYGISEHALWEGFYVASSRRR
jgi:hypothetical protein